MISTNYGDLKPLGVTCTSTDCENGLHCFLQKKAQAARLSTPWRSVP